MTSSPVRDYGVEAARGLPHGTAVTDGGLSDFWRIDRSQDRALELSSVLQGADTLIGNMGSDITVRWSGDGVSYTDFGRRIVALDYGPLTEEESPFAGALVDEVIGYATHEGGHCLWSRPGAEQTIMRRVEEEWNALPPSLQRAWQAGPREVMTELARLQNVLEDAYIDHQVMRNWPILGSYIRIARNQLLECIPMDLRAEVSSPNPDRNAVVNLWASLSLYDQPYPVDLSAPVERCIRRLMELSGEAREAGEAAARQAMAVEAAAVLWKEFPTDPTPNPEPPHTGAAEEPESGENRSGGSGPGRAEDDSDGADGGSGGFGDNDQGGPGAPARSDGMGASGQGTEKTTGPRQSKHDWAPGRQQEEYDLSTAFERTGARAVQVPEHLLRSMAGATNHDQQDLSQPVAVALGEPPSLVSVTARQGTYDAERAARVISKVRREIKEVRRSFQQQRDLRTRWIYGLDQGRLDESRLWKTFVGDPGYRKRRDVPQRPSLAVGLLLDMSGSMSQYSHILEETGAIFSQGLISSRGIDFAVWCYTGRIAEAVLTKVSGSDSTKLCLGDVEPGGSTPSGVAIAAATEILCRMPKKKRLLIHFTDGLPDDVEHVRKAVHSAREVGIQVYAIGLPEHEKMLVDQYGERNCQTIESVPELPMAVARILSRLSAA